MRKIVAIGILVFEGYLIMSFSRSVWDLWKKQEEIGKERARVQALETKNRQLQSQLAYEQTDAFVEKVAREKLNYIKPGETVVVIPQDMLRAATASAVPPPTPPNWQQWIRLFF